MALDLRSELRRPISLGLAVATAVLLLIVVIMAVRHSKERRGYEQQLSTLQNEKAGAQNELARQRVMTGTLTELQAKITDSEKQGQQANQVIQQAQDQIASLELRRKEAEQAAVDQATRLSPRDRRIEHRRQMDLFMDNAQVVVCTMSATRSPPVQQLPPPGWIP